MLPQCYKRHSEAFLSRIYTGDETWFFHNIPESKVELMTWKHPHSPVKKKFKTVQPPGKVIATVFSVVCGLLLVDLTPLSSTINAAGNSEETQGSYLAKETRMLTKGVLALQYSAQPHSEFFELMRVGGFSTSTKQSWFGLLDFRLFQEMKSTFEVSASTRLNMFKTKSRTGYVPSTHFCVWRTWQMDMSLWYVSKQTLWLCGVVKLIWDCVWAPSITLYVVILCK